jgi:hypothetical protein
MRIKATIKAPIFAMTEASEPPPILRITLDRVQTHCYLLAALRTHPVRGKGCAHLNLHSYRSSPSFCLMLRTPGAMKGGYYAQHQRVLSSREA